LMVARPVTVLAFLGGICSIPEVNVGPKPGLERVFRKYLEKSS